MSSIRATWLLLCLVLVAAFAMASTVHATVADGDLETEAEQAFAIASELTTDERMAADAANVMLGEAVSDADHELFDGVEQELFGHVHHVSDTNAETEAMDAADAEVIAEAQAALASSTDDITMIERRAAPARAAPARAAQATRRAAPAPRRAGVPAKKAAAGPRPGKVHAKRAAGKKAGVVGKRQAGKKAGKPGRLAAKKAAGKKAGRVAKAGKAAKKAAKKATKAAKKLGKKAARATKRATKKASRAAKKVAKKAKRSAKKAAKVLAKKLGLKGKKAGKGKKSKADKAAKKAAKAKAKAAKKAAKAKAKAAKKAKKAATKAAKKKAKAAKKAAKAAKKAAKKTAKAAKKAAKAKAKADKKRKAALQKPLPLHLRKHDSYRSRRRASEAKGRSAEVLKKALVTKAIAAKKANDAKVAAAKSKLAKQKAEAALAKAEKAKIAKALKVRATLDKIEAEKQKIAKALYTKQAVEKQAKEAFDKIEKERKAATAKQHQVAQEQYKLMTERQAVDKMKSEVRVLAQKAKMLHKRFRAVQAGEKPLTTQHVLEDGLGDGRLEDGFVRNVPRPDRQAQKAFDYAVSEVMPDAEAVAGNIQQHIIDASFPLMQHADEVREAFDDFKIEMKQTRATPDGWPKAVFEAEDINPGN